MARILSGARVVGVAEDEEYAGEEILERVRDQAVCDGFEPVGNPEIAVAVIVENWGGGSSTAAPVARELFDAWLLEFQQPGDEALVGSVGSGGGG